MKSDVDVGHLLGHAARGFGEQREVGGADAALVVQTPQPPLGPVDEVGTRAEPELAEALARRGRARLVRNGASRDRHLHGSTGADARHRRPRRCSGQLADQIANTLRTTWAHHHASVTLIV
jgi:hypothetical protein